MNGLVVFLFALRSCGSGNDLVCSRGLQELQKIPTVPAARIWQKEFLFRSSFLVPREPAVFLQEHRPCSAENSEKAGGSATVVAGLRECTPPCALPHHGGRRAGHPVTVWCETFETCMQPRGAGPRRSSLISAHVFGVKNVLMWRWRFLPSRSAILALALLVSERNDQIQTRLAR